MPELPEVEVVRIQLKHKVRGKTIASVDVFHDKTVAYETAIEEILVGKTIANIDRIGKLLIFSFSDEADMFLLAHLKMTGQFIYVDDDGALSGGGHTMAESDVTDLPGRHTRVTYHFTDGSALHFNDMRLFGYTKLATAASMQKARAGFGPEPIDPDFDCEWFANTLRQKKSLVKAALLDQSFVAGLGNIYVDEALWRAEVRPTRRANKVTKSEAAALCAATGAVMRESIASGGTTFKDFLDTGGAYGNFTDCLKVFGRNGQTCERCGTIIKKIRAAGRGTHYCPGCQT